VSLRMTFSGGGRSCMCVPLSPVTNYLSDLSMISGFKFSQLEMSELHLFASTADPESDIAVLFLILRGRFSFAPSVICV
jgi:hypothetical protein